MVESSGLLNRRRPLKSTGGSNPPLSASIQKALSTILETWRAIPGNDAGMRRAFEPLSDGRPRTPDGGADTRSIAPTTWWPGITGSFRAGNSPSTTCRSVRQTPQARTRISTSFAEGSGTVGSARARGRLSTGAGVCNAQARIRSAAYGKNGENSRPRATNGL